MHIVGRKVEQDKLEQCILSGKPEFVVVYGRRRVGKTFLIKEYFNNNFSFYSTGLPDGKLSHTMTVPSHAMARDGRKALTITTVPTRNISTSAVLTISA